MKKFFVLLVAVVVGFSGCATIIHGTNQDVRISSDPTGADVVIYNSHNTVVYNSSTPAVAKLKRGEGFFGGATYRVEITKPGYQTQTVHISSSLASGSYLVGNFLFGGFLGWLIVDPLTGGMWVLKPKSIDSSLRQSLSLKDDVSADGIYIVLKEQIPENVFSTLELVKVN
jgi:uncharacterized protein YceK